MKHTPPRNYYNQNPSYDFSTIRSQWQILIKDLTLDKIEEKSIQIKNSPIWAQANTLVEKLIFSVLEEPPETIVLLARLISKVVQNQILSPLDWTNPTSDKRLRKNKLFRALTDKIRHTLKSADIAGNPDKIIKCIFQMEFNTQK